MLGLAQSLGCSPSDYACLCSNQNFGYGIRDCSNEACKDPANAAKVIQFGTTFCQGKFHVLHFEYGERPNSPIGIVASASGAGATVSGSALSVLSSAASTFGTAAAPLSTPISTSAILSVVSTGGSAYTTVIGESTIYGAAGSAANSAGSAAASATGSAASAASSLEGSAASAASSIEASASGAAASAASSAAGAASSAISSLAGAASSAGAAASSKASSAAGSASASASSTGAAPRQTAAPILGGAALAALLLI
jgi:hypothetical protein